MKKLFAGIGIALLFVALMWGASQMFPNTATATTAVQQTDGCVYGSTTSTGAAINVPLGFYPSYVIVSRVSGTAANNFQLQYSRSMTNGYGILHTAGALTYITTAGISTYASTTAGKGFTIGTNSSINPSSPADTLHWVACR